MKTLRPVNICNNGQVCEKPSRKEARMSSGGAGAAAVLASRRRLFAHHVCAYSIYATTYSHCFYKHSEILRGQSTCEYSFITHYSST